jgi:hypothetical protein
MNVVLAAERDGGAGAAVHEVRIGAVVAGGAAQHFEHGGQALHRLPAGDPAALGGHDQGHGAEAGAAYGDQVVVLLAVGPAAVRRKAAERVRGLPEEAEGLPLHRLDQILVRQRGQGRGGGSLVGAAAAPEPRQRVLVCFGHGTLLVTEILTCLGWL